jgi:ComF family protein
LLRATEYPVCRDCIGLLAETPLEQACSLCSEPLGFESVTAADLSRSATPTCPACQLDAPKFQRAVAFGAYDELRPTVHLMKFENVPSLAKPLGGLLAQAILSLRQGEHSVPDEMTVVPVPLFRGKRSYNQSALLAESALRHVRTAAPEWRLRLAVDTLARARKTESQFLLSPAQRRQNVRNAFTVRGNVAGQAVLLIDDVYTTGATVAECTRILLRAGARSVHVATLARAGREVAVRWQPQLATARDGPVPPTLFP